MKTGKTAPGPGKKSIRQSRVFDEMPYLKLPSTGDWKTSGGKGDVSDGQFPLGLLVRRANLALSRGLNQRLKERNVTPAQWVFLRMLWNEDGLNQKDIAERVGVHPTTAVPALNILERSGYVKRERSDADRRNVTVRLTREGKALARELVPVALEQNRRALAGISDKDAGKLMELLLSVLHNLEDRAQDEPD